MSASASQQASTLLDQAELQARCLEPLSKAQGLALFRLKQRGAVVSPLEGLFIRTEAWDQLNPVEKHLHIARALHERHPHWIFCGPTAAAAHGLAINYKFLHHIHLCHPTDTNRKTGLLTHHRFNSQMINPQYPLEFHAGIPVVSLEAAAVQCLCLMDFTDGLSIADSTLRATGKSVGWLGAQIDELGHGFRGIKQARITTRFANALSENGGESTARAKMIKLGFRIPELQVNVTDSLSGSHYRVDYYWTCDDGSAIAGELDGRQKYSDPTMTQGHTSVEVFAEERLRESRITREMRVVRFSYANVCDSNYFQALLDSYHVPRVSCPPVTTAAQRKRRG